MIKTLIKILPVVSLLAGSTAFCAGFIDTPDSCYIPERVGKGEAHLKKVGVCAGTPGRAFIDTDTTEINVMIDGTLWKRVKLQDLAVEDISQALDKGAKFEGQIVIPENKWAAEMGARAAQSNNLYLSDAYQANLKKESDRLRVDIFGDNSEPAAGPEKEKPSDKKPGKRLNSDERVYLFVSNSVPLQTIRNYVESVSRLGDPNIMIVMRGFIGGVSKVAPTFRFVNSAIKVNPACDETREECMMKNASISVDPLLFRRYGVDHVPAVVYAQGVALLDLKMSEGNPDNANVKDFYKIYGDASLEYLLERIQRDSSSPSLSKLLSMN